MNAINQFSMNFESLNIEFFLFWKFSKSNLFSKDEDISKILCEFLWLWFNISFGNFIAFRLTPKDSTKNTYL